MEKRKTRFVFFLENLFYAVMGYGLLWLVFNIGKVKGWQQGYEDYSAHTTVIKKQNDSLNEQLIKDIFYAKGMAKGIQIKDSLDNAKK